MRTTLLCMTHVPRSSTFTCHCQVPCCGYDSIPADLGAVMVADHMRKQLGK
jgi:short subunit dehydrogenase-like uncharacterized protein